MRNVRTVTCSVDGDARIIDFDITLKATPGAVTFGDTKEGAFGIRIPTSMDVDSKPGGKIVNSEGQTDKEAWGKPARWVDYHGPVDDQQLASPCSITRPASAIHPCTCGPMACLLAILSACTTSTPRSPPAR